MSSDIKWIKIVTDIFDDEKILLIEAMPDADTIIVIWFKLLCLAGRLNSNGILILNERIAYTDEMLSHIFRRPINTVRLALKTFEQFGMIEIINDTIVIPNWEKHQNIEGMEKIREQTRKRVAEYRGRQKLKASNDVTLQVTHCNGTEKEIDKEGDKKETILTDGKEKPLKRFTPPTIEEVRAYCHERGDKIDPEQFMDKMQSVGWVDKNGNKLKDWKAAIRTWERYEKAKVSKPTKVVQAQQYNQRDYTEAELDAVSDDLIAEAKRLRGGES